MGPYLSRDGHDVVSATDGEEALAVFRESEPDLVVLDLMLPKLSGLEVRRKMRAVRKGPLIMLTARGEGDERVLGLSLGADDYVAKPFSPRELAARVAAVLRRVEDRRGRRHLRCCLQEPSGVFAGTLAQRRLTKRSLELRKAEVQFLGTSLPHTLVDKALPEPSCRDGANKGARVRRLKEERRPHGSD